MYFKILCVSVIVILNGFIKIQANPYSKLSRYKRKAAECIPRGDALDTSMCDSVIPIPDELRQEFSLDPFYHKYTHAYGIPVFSSGAVSKEAMLRACYTVRFMLADRQDVRNELHDRCARISVIGRYEKTNQMPEYTHLDDIYNDRTRGIGGTLKNPVSIIGEENLLCYNYEHDRWYSEDIGVHEFAHAIHLIGMNKVVSGFKKKLKDTHNAAIEAGLWSSTYASTNNKEYFAEGVQKFFGVDVVQEYTDGIHNHISNRTELLDYDPALYDLALETFPCANKIVSRCDDQSLIETQPLMMNCDGARTARTTIKPTTTDPTTINPTTTSLTSANPTTISPTTPTYQACTDSYNACKLYKSWCSKNALIRRMCRKSCELCDVCDDFHPRCDTYKEYGFCDTEADLMSKSCRKKCGWCV